MAVRAASKGTVVKHKRLKVGARVTVAANPGNGKVYKARVVSRGGFWSTEDPNYIHMYLKVSRQTIAERLQNEGVSWCRGWVGEAVDALKASATLAE